MRRVIDPTGESFDMSRQASASKLPQGPAAQLTWTTPKDSIKFHGLVTIIQLDSHLAIAGLGS